MFEQVEQGTVRMMYSHRKFKVLNDKVGNQLFSTIHVSDFKVNPFVRLTIKQ